MGTPMKELEKELKELKGSATPWEEQSYQPTKPYRSFQGLKHQPMSTHGETHGSRCICSRGWHSLTSVRGEAFGPVKAHIPSVGECKALKWERGVGRESSFMEAMGGGGRMRLVERG